MLLFRYMSHNDSEYPPSNNIDSYLSQSEQENEIHSHTKISQSYRFLLIAIFVLGISLSIFAIYAVVIRYSAFKELLQDYPRVKDSREETVSKITDLNYTSCRKSGGEIQSRPTRCTLNNKVYYYKDLFPSFTFNFKEQGVVLTFPKDSIDDPDKNGLLLTPDRAMQSSWANAEFLVSGPYSVSPLYKDVPEMTIYSPFSISSEISYDSGHHFSEYYFKYGSSFDKIDQILATSYDPSTHIASTNKAPDYGAFMVVGKRKCPLEQYESTNDIVNDTPRSFQKSELIDFDEPTSGLFDSSEDADYFALSTLATSGDTYSVNLIQVAESVDVTISLEEDTQSGQKVNGDKITIKESKIPLIIGIRPASGSKVGCDANYTFTVSKN